MPLVVIRHLFPRKATCQPVVHCVVTENPELEESEQRLDMDERAKSSVRALKEKFAEFNEANFYFEYINPSDVLSSVENQTTDLKDSDHNLKLLANYSQERGTLFTVENLIQSHRNLIQELNNGQRRENKEALEQAIAKAEQQVLDSNWIKIEKLREMTIAEIADLIAL